MSEQQKHFSWADGLPTGPDVEMLRKKWPNLEAGDRINYSDVAEIIGVKYGSTRFTTVTNAWRKREEEKGIIIQCDKGQAFYVANAEQITSGTYTTLRHIGRSAHKQRKHLGTIRYADDATRNVVEHQARLMIEVEKDAKTKRMNVLPSLKSPDVRVPLPRNVEVA